MTEGGMVEWHHQLNGHEFEQTSESSEGQGNLECYSPWTHIESDSHPWETSLPSLVKLGSGGCRAHPLPTGCSPPPSSRKPSGLYGKRMCFSHSTLLTPTLVASPRYLRLPQC